MAFIECYNDKNIYINFYIRSIYMSCNSCEKRDIELSNGSKCVLKENKRKKIWKQCRMSASHGLFRKKSLLVSNMVGECASSNKLSQAGGPGDCKTSKNNGKKGVDKKHGSYARYLARRVGGELRKEKGKQCSNPDTSCCDRRIK
jgi:hypothetical protein